MPDVHLAPSFSGYVSKPKTDGPIPGLILIQEIFGVNDVMRQLADDYAAEGYFVVCPDLFWRQEPGIQLTDKTPEGWARAFELYKGFDEDLGVTDLKKTLEWLKAQPGCSGKVAALGYCLGGKLAYLCGTRLPVTAAVSYYGVGIEAALDELDADPSPLLLHIAGKDEFVPTEAQYAILDKVDTTASATAHVYPERNHAFCRPEGEHYDKEDADLANQRSRAFLQEHLTS